MRKTLPLALAAMSISWAVNAEPRLLSDETLDNLSAGGSILIGMPGMTPVSNPPRPWIVIAQGPDALDVRARINGPGQIQIKESVTLAGTHKPVRTGLRLAMRCAGSCASKATIKVRTRRAG